MPTTKAGPVRGSQHGSSVSVRPAAAAKILDDILRKPGKHGDTPSDVKNKRGAIGQGTCKPSEALLICLANNGHVEEYVLTLRVLLNPGETARPIAEVARRVTATERQIAQPIEELFASRASSHDYAVLARGAHELDEEVAELSELAARQQHAPAIRRTA